MPGSYQTSAYLTNVKNAFASAMPTLFTKADVDSTVITALTDHTAAVKAGTVVANNGYFCEFPEQKTIEMPAVLYAGNDYTVWVAESTRLIAVLGTSAPTGFTTSTARKIGGFYYAHNSRQLAITNRERTDNVATLTMSAGHGLVTGDTIDVSLMGNTTYNCIDTAITVTGDSVSYASIGDNEGSTGDTAGKVVKTNGTGSINSYSIWDLKWRPFCADPSGMVLVAGSFWADIWLTGIDHLTYGTSKKGQKIADGEGAASYPLIPPIFGGTGSSRYTSFNWWQAAEVLAHHGKQLPTYDEFAELAYGVTEGTSSGTDPVVNCRRAGFVSAHGVELATGNMFVWGAGDSFRLDGESAAVPSTKRARSSDVATITLSTASHGLNVGDVVTLSSFGGSGYNRAYTTILTVSGAVITVGSIGTDEGETADTSGKVTALNPAWSDRSNTGSRGKIFLHGQYGLVSPTFGGAWYLGSVSGSRSAGWSYYPWLSNGSTGARGRSDHLKLF